VKSKRDICIISSEFPPQPGGIGSHAYNLAKQLHLQGKSVTVLTDNRSATGKEEAVFDFKCIVPVQRVRVTQPRILMYLTRVWKAFKLVKKNRILLVSGKFPLWLGAVLGLFFPIKKIAVVHGTEVNFKHKLLKKSVDIALSRYQHIIAVSNHTKTLLTPANRLKCVVIPNGIDPDKFDACKEIQYALKGDLRLITVGNVTHRKGQLNVIRQLPELRKVFPDIHYHVVGLPTCKEEFLKVADALKVKEMVTFHGVLPDETLKACLLNSTVFVMLSSETVTGDIEGFGIALLEANYLGVPAIGANGCGIEDAVLEGSSGHLITYNDTEAFIKAIRNIGNHQKRFAQEAAKWGNKHRWENVIHDYLKYLNA
jgi:phosphatidylinositol alpha-1,6-mannosyltransferase